METATELKTAIRMNAQRASIANLAADEALKFTQAALNAANAFEKLWAISHEEGK